LTATIAPLERDLAGRPAREVGDMAAARGVSPNADCANATLVWWKSVTPPHR